MSDDRKIRIFRFLTGKIYRTFDDSLESYQEAQRDPDFPYRLDDIDFGRKMAVDRELYKNLNEVTAPNCVFDESSNFIIYPTPIGLKCSFFFSSNSVIKSKIYLFIKLISFSHITIIIIIIIIFIL